MKNVKRNIVIVVVLLFVCAAVWLNWSYNNKWGAADEAMTDAEDAAMAASEAGYDAAMGETGETGTAAVASDYFASARLTRQQSRDEALNLLESATTAETASQEVIDSALSEISCMAAWSMQESQIENLLIAKEFADCVVFISEDCVTVAVPAPVDGLTEASVARITDTITTETDFTADQIKIIEIRDE